jgi:CHASE2 domain-containing sensor protein
LLPINKKLQLIIIGISVSIVSVFLITIIFVEFPETGELAGNLDIFFYKKFFRPTHKPPRNLIIIDSNDPAMQRSRSEYAEMINKLKLAGAKCIALDIVFYKKSIDNPEEDQKLVKVVRECPQVILTIDFGCNETPSISTIALSELVLPDSFCEKLFPVDAPEEVCLPFDSLLSAAKHIGHINTVSGEYYHFPLAIKYNRKCFASLPVEIVRFCLESEGLTFPPAEIPTDKDGQLLVNFIPLKHFRPYPYPWDKTIKFLKEQPIESSEFKNAIVIIVNPSGETKIPTLLGSYPRWAILASITSQLLQNRHIKASDASDEAIFSALLVFIGLIWFLFLSPRIKKKWQKTRFVFGTGNLLLLILVYLSLNLGNQWLGVIVAVIVFNVSLFVVRNRYYTIIKPPQYSDLVIHVLEPQDGKYPIKVQSTVGEEEENAFFESFLEEAEFQEMLQTIRNLSAGRTEMRWMGNKLFNAIFPGDIFHILKNNIEKVQNDNQLLRLRLSIDAPELICLPWELMHSLKIAPGFLVLNKRISVTRYISLFQPLKKPEFHIPLKILVVVSSPSDLQPLDVTREIKLLKKSLRSLRFGGDVRLRFCRKATLENLRNELDRAPDVIHFIGHSYFDSKKNESFLCFESEKNQYELIDEETIGNMLHDSSVKLVILNSCESATATEGDVFTGIAQNLVKIGVPAVLAMQIEIPDQTAIWFSSVFYSNFLTKYSIEFAVVEARRYIMTKIKLDRPDWAIPVLFMRSDETFQS